MMTLINGIALAVARRRYLVRMTHARLVVVARTTQPLPVRISAVMWIAVDMVGISRRVVTAVRMIAAWITSTHTVWITVEYAHAPALVLYPISALSSGSYRVTTGTLIDLV